mmetsp:Transcript_22860/g.53337  ORF Transcript_22860/g.53337 Transcript_22860/m.53337 type:complete len:444 (-) Transcript_22860:568-1899(-)
MNSARPGGCLAWLGDENSASGVFFGGFELRRACRKLATGLLTTSVATPLPMSQARSMAVRPRLSLNKCFFDTLATLAATAAASGPCDVGGAGASGLAPWFHLYTPHRLGMKRNGSTILEDSPISRADRHVFSPEASSNSSWSASAASLTPAKHPPNVSDTLLLPLVASRIGSVASSALSTPARPADSSESPPSSDSLSESSSTTMAPSIVVSDSLPRPDAKAVERSESASSFSGVISKDPVFFRLGGSKSKDSSRPSGVGGTLGKTPSDPSEQAESGVSEDRASLVLRIFLKRRTAFMVAACVGPNGHGLVPEKLYIRCMPRSAAVHNGIAVVTLATVSGSASVSREARGKPDSCSSETKRSESFFTFQGRVTARLRINTTSSLDSRGSTSTRRGAPVVRPTSEFSSSKTPSMVRSDRSTLCCTSSHCGSSDNSLFSPALHVA